MGKNLVVSVQVSVFFLLLNIYNFSLEKLLQIIARIEEDKKYTKSCIYIQ